jgi:hypothetical protein
MADSISSIPTSITGMTPDRQPRRDDKREHPDGDAPVPMTTQAALHVETPPPMAIDDPAVVPETLFSASILGQRLRSLAADLKTMNLKREQDWAPPESALRLKDKSI